MATEVEFHTGVADATGFVCRLLRKAHRQGARVLVTAPVTELAELDRRLWTQEALEFLPHVRLPAAERVAARSPIWLSTGLPEGGLAEADGRVLINLGADLPAASTAPALPRIIEVVSADPEGAAAGRQRWRQYKSMGLAIVHHTAA
jgi:DNA polymerase III subunit chi